VQENQQVCVATEGEGGPPLAVKPCPHLSVIVTPRLVRFDLEVNPLPPGSIFPLSSFRSVAFSSVQ